MSQRLAIRAALLRGKKISALSALREFGCMRLGARILEIRKGQAGAPPLDVSDSWRTQKEKRYKVYFVPGAVSERYKAVLLANSKAGAALPGRPRRVQAASRDVSRKLLQK